MRTPASLLALLLSVLAASGGGVDVLRRSGGGGGGVGSLASPREWPVRQHLDTPSFNGTRATAIGFHVIAELLLATSPHQVAAGSEARDRVVLVAPYADGGFEGDQRSEYWPLQQWVDACVRGGCVGLIKQSHTEFAGREAAWHFGGYDASKVLLPMVEVSLPDGNWLYEDLLHNRQMSVWVKLRHDDPNVVVNMLEDNVWFVPLRYLVRGVLGVVLGNALWKLVLCVRFRDELFVTSDGASALLCFIGSLVLRVLLGVIDTLPLYAAGWLPYFIRQWFEWYVIVLTMLGAVLLSFGVYRTHSRLNSFRGADTVFRGFTSMQVLLVLSILVVDVLCCTLPFFYYGASRHHKVGERFVAIVSFVVSGVFFYIALRFRSTLRDTADTMLRCEAVLATRLYHRVVICSVFMFIFSVYMAFCYDFLWRVLNMTNKAAAQELFSIFFESYLLLLQFVLIRTTVIRSSDQEKLAGSGLGPQDFRMSQELGNLNLTTSAVASGR